MGIANTASGAWDAATPLWLMQSPYYGETDFSVLRGCAESSPIDPVSLADILRNGFVYPPHSIHTGVKVTTFGFDVLRQAGAASEFRFPFCHRPERPATSQGDALDTYHSLLCKAVSASSTGMKRPWMLQSGGKDSTSIAIALANARPDAICITYLGGREEDEVASSRAVARRLGLRHEALTCDAGRAYDRYVALAPRVPLLTGDFAMLSYADLAVHVAGSGGDGILDGLGSDAYFGTPVSRRLHVLSALARRVRLPSWVFRIPLIGRDFRLSYVLATIQMDPFERFFPGSRFSDTEVDELLGYPIASRSRLRLETFASALREARTADERRALSVVIAEAASAFAKGLYATAALGIRIAYPFCDASLREWVFRSVPNALLVDPLTRANKPLVRNHIGRYFGELPYVARKGSFRFDLHALAAERFDQVYTFAEDAMDILPGALSWLRRNRNHLDNKVHASKFYLLALALPWLIQRISNGHSCDSARHR